jgi:hypothetical protein
MSTSPYTVKTARAPSAVNAHPERLESADGSRWATGRTVKKPIGNRCWEPVRVWTLKTRDAAGKAVVRDTYVTREAAEAWVRG